MAGASVSGSNLIISRDQAFCFTQVRRKNPQLPLIRLLLKTAEPVAYPSQTLRHAFTARSFAWRGKLRKGTCLGNGKPGI